VVESVRHERGMAVWNRSRVAAWLLVGVLSSCASAAPSGGGANTAAAAAGATVALRPVDGEVSPEPRAGIGPFDSSILSMATAEGAIAISLANASSVRLLDSRTGQLTAELASPTPNVIGLKFSPGAKHLTAISRQQNEVYVWDVVARTPARTIRAANRVWGAVSLRGGARVVLAGEHGTLVLVAVDTGQVVRSLPVRETFKAESAPERLTVYGLALSRSGQWLAAVVGGTCADPGRPRTQRCDSLRQRRCEDAAVRERVLARRPLCPGPRLVVFPPADGGSGAPPRGG